MAARYIWRANECLTLIVLYVAACSIHLTYSQSNETCLTVSKHYSALHGLTKKDVPITPLSGTHLKICPVGKTCCTADMEKKLNRHSKREYERIIGSQISSLKKIFISQTQRFNDFFTALLETSKINLHTMFSETYGVRYKQNAHVFLKLFADLQNYYRGKDINLLDTIDNFFSEVFVKMFVLLNDSYKFSSSYLNCVSEYFGDLKPFGDSPEKMATQVKRVFIAARTFTQGLAIGRDVIAEISKLSSTGSCHNAIMKMRYCPYCNGLPTLKPCHNYCMNVMKGCLASQADLDEHFNNYLESLLKVGDRLQGPFNYQSVVQPIALKISDAIMMYQENTDKVKEKVFKVCNRPERKGRKKRDASQAKRQTFDGGLPIVPTGPKMPPPRKVTLEQMVKELRNSLKVQKSFWSSLPHKLCVKKKFAEEVLSHNASLQTNCWNGARQGRYQPEVMKDGRLAQNNNPEVEVDVTKPTTILDSQTLQLKLITNKLKNAFNGLDVASIDIDPSDTIDMSGSGSGSGWVDPGSGHVPKGRDPDIGFPTRDHTIKYSVLPGKTTAPPGGNNNGVLGETKGTSAGSMTLASHLVLALSVLCYTVQMVML